MLDNHDGATARPEDTIAGAAEHCVRAFQRCIQLSATLSSRDLSLIEDQIARFSSWMTGIGVFAQGRASTDHRLREATDVRDITIGVLEALSDRIHDTSTILQGKAESLDEECEGGSPDITDHQLERVIQAISKDMTLLHRLTNTIRKAGKESQNIRAATSYRIRDDEGNDVEPNLQQVFAQYIYGRFPGSNKNLRQRLASTMVLRRRRILYGRSRYGLSSMVPTMTILQPKIEFPGPQQATAVSIPESDEPVPASRVADSVTPTSIAPSVPVSATTLAPEDFRRKSTPSVVSASNSIAHDNDKELAFPPAPSGRIRGRYKALINSNTGCDSNKQPFSEEEGSDIISKRLQSHNTVGVQASSEEIWERCFSEIPEVTCPFCLYALPSRDICNDKKWKTHVKKDLDAYICLFDACDKPDELYGHKSDWLNHMRTHTLQWHCSSKSHGRLTFPTEKQHLDHIMAAHAKAFTEPQLHVLAQRNSRPRGPMFEFCPICGTDDVATGLEEHISVHLESLALKSLPPYFTHDESEGSTGIDRSSVAALSESRTTIKDSTELNTKPVFQDNNYRQARDRFKPESDNQSPYRLWGGFRKYIQLNGHEGEQAHPNLENQADNFNFPPPLEADDSNQSLWNMDLSGVFVEPALFKGIPLKDWRDFEWGFLVRLKDGRYKDAKDDIAIQSMLKYISVRAQMTTTGGQPGEQSTMKRLSTQACRDVSATRSSLHQGLRHLDGIGSHFLSSHNTVSDVTRVNKSVCVSCRLRRVQCRRQDDTGNCDNCRKHGVACANHYFFHDLQNSSKYHFGQYLLNVAIAPHMQKLFMIDAPIDLEKILYCLSLFCEKYNVRIQGNGGLWLDLDLAACRQHWEQVALEHDNAEGPYTVEDFITRKQRWQDTIRWRSLLLVPTTQQQDNWDSPLGAFARLDGMSGLEVYSLVPKAGNSPAVRPLDLQNAADEVLSFIATITFQRIRHYMELAGYRSLERILSGPRTNDYTGSVRNLGLVLLSLRRRIAICKVTQIWRQFHSGPLAEHLDELAQVNVEPPTVGRVVEFCFQLYVHYFCRYKKMSESAQQSYLEDGTQTITHPYAGIVIKEYPPTDESRDGFNIWMAEAEHQITGVDESSTLGREAGDG